MKKIFITIFVVCIAFTSCKEKSVEPKTIDKTAQIKDNNLKFKVVSDEEYAAATKEEKKLYDNINAAAEALMRLDESYSAHITINKKNLNDSFSAIIISKENIEEKKLKAREAKVDGSCTVCGVRSAYKCLKKLRQIEDDEFDVHVKRVGSCVELSW